MNLTDENIQASVEKAAEYLKVHSIEKSQCLCYQLLLEEILLEYKREYADACYSVRCKRLGKNVSIQLIVESPEFNPIDAHPSSIVKQLLPKFQYVPTWEYKSGKNIITYAPALLLTNLRNARFVLSYMMRNKKSFSCGVLLRLLNMGLTIIQPILSARIIVAYSGSEINKVIQIALLILGVTALSSLVDYFASRTLRVCYNTMVRDLRHDLTENVLQIKTSCVEENGSGVFTERLISETRNSVNYIDNLVAVSSQVFHLISVLISLAAISKLELLLEIALFVVYILIQRAHTRVVNDYDRQYRVKTEQFVGFVNEMVRAHRDIKLLHSEESFMQKLRISVTETVDLDTAMRVKSMEFICLRSQFVAWTNFIYMGLLALLMSKFGMAPAEALVLYNFNGNIYSCSGFISTFVGTINAMNISNERIYQLMHSRDFEKESFGTVHLDKVRGDIELKDVHFSYHHLNGGVVDVLKGISLHIHAGESVAFIGRSGCGKTTLLSLLSRLYDPDSGSILLDGVDMQTLDRDSIRSNISMVSQMPYIFNMSIRENLALIKSDMTDEEMINVCKTACIHDDIMGFPQGYDTVIGEGGVTISGGQRQRLALARSMLKDYPVIMLDEATSALDNLTQANIRKAIEKLNGESTIIMVAHRLSTVVNCDRLFFISDGKLLAQGTHRELLETCEEYRMLYSEEDALA